MTAPPVGLASRPKHLYYGSAASDLLLLHTPEQIDSGDMPLGDHALSSSQHTVSRSGPGFHEDITSVLKVPARGFDLTQGHSTRSSLDCAVLGRPERRV